VAANKSLTCGLHLYNSLYYPSRTSVPGLLLFPSLSRSECRPTASSSLRISSTLGHSSFKTSRICYSSYRFHDNYSFDSQILSSRTADNEPLYHRYSYLESDSSVTLSLWLQHPQKARSVKNYSTDSHLT
jgi:hypothetical protein